MNVMRTYCNRRRSKWKEGREREEERGEKRSEGGGEGREGGRRDGRGRRGVMRRGWMLCQG